MLIPVKGDSAGAGRRKVLSGSSCKERQKGTEWTGERERREGYNERTTIQCQVGTRKKQREARMEREKEKKIRRRTEKQEPNKNDNP